MEFVLQLLVTLAAFAAVVGGLAWLGTRARRRGVGGSVLGAVDEIFHPAAYGPRIEVESQAERKVAMPSPGDLPAPGRTRVDLRKPVPRDHPTARP